MSARLYVGGLLAAVLVACSVPQPAGVEVRPAPKHGALRIAQVDHGLHARFALCKEMECPQVTPKTLAIVVEERPQALAAPEPAHVEFGLPVKQPRPTITVRFAANSAVLDRKARALLDSRLDEIGPRTTVLVRGRTDIKGPRQLNERLAERRALAVSRYVQSRLPQRELEFRRDARGKCCYVARNTTAAGRAANRRAEVSAQAEPPAPPGPSN